jgi:hypothetical protein
MVMVLVDPTIGPNTSAIGESMTTRGEEGKRSTARKVEGRLRERERDRETAGAATPRQLANRIRLLMQVKAAATQKPATYAPQSQAFDVGQACLKDAGKAW